MFCFVYWNISSHSPSILLYTWLTYWHFIQVFGGRKWDPDRGVGMAPRSSESPVGSPAGFKRSASFGVGASLRMLKKSNTPSPLTTVKVSGSRR